MNDSEIIKALECCVNNQHCWLCVLKGREDDCHDILKSALDLIKRQQTELEKAKSEAVREFAERLKPMLSFGRYTSYEQIDNLVKEMGCNDG